MKILPLIAASGLSLLILYPIGLYTTGVCYSLFFIVHLLLHLYALGLSLTTVTDIFREEEGGHFTARSLALLILGVALPILLLGAFSAAPVTARDSLIHHLAVPQMWLQKGAIHIIPWHEWSFYPNLIHLAYTGLLGLGFEQLTAIYHGSFLFFLAALLVESTKKDFSNRIVQLGVIVTFTTPLLFRLGSEPMVDLPLSVYGLAALLTLFTEQKELKFSKSLLLGVFLGLAACTKYNGLLFAALFLPLFLFPVNQKSSSIRALPVAVSMLVLINLPWMLRNYFATGNPIFPLLPSIFPSTDLLLSIPQAVSESTKGGAWYETVLLPLQMILQGKDDSPVGFDAILSPLYLFALAAPFSKRNRSSLVYTFCFTLVYIYAAIHLSGPRTRYLAPVLGIAILLTMSGVRTLLSFGKERVQHLILTALVVFQIGFGSLYAFHLLEKRSIIPVLTGELGRTRYLNQKVSESLLADVVNGALPKDAKVYLLDTGNRYYLYKKDVFNSGYFSDRHLVTWIKSRKKPLLTYFQENGITHLALHRKRYERSFKHYKDIGFLTEEDFNRWNTFTKEHFVALFERTPYLIGEIK